jgi:hypothetical protein
VLYSRLLKDFQPRIEGLFEVGLGTNNPDLPSSMGPTGIPGASLRAWAQFLPEAQIYGADVDSEILFQEERIKTYYVDQLSGPTIDTMWSSIPQTFNLIIDDGLHTFDANKNFLTHSWGKLKPRGLYIVEDIAANIDNLKRFDDFLTQLGHNGFLFVLPHPWNKIDNGVAVLQAGGKSE